MNPLLIKKAVALLGSIVTRKDGSYMVAGGSGTYTITFPRPGAFSRDEHPRCSCPANISGNVCSHILAVQFYRERHAQSAIKKVSI